MNAFTITGRRQAHIAGKDIIAEALAARDAICKAERDEAERAARARNAETVAHNAGLLAGNPGDFIPGVSVGKRRQHAAVSAKRGFRFTIEGRDGVWKLETKWRPFSPFEYEPTEYEARKLEGVQ